MKPILLRTLLGGLAAGMIGVVSVAPAAAAPADDVPAARVTEAAVLTPPAPLLHLLPEPLACLATTGFALFCLGIA